MNNEIYSSIAQYFERTLEQHGPTAKGVDWRDETAQEMRFEQLLKILPVAQEVLEKPTLVDFGCGYGQLFEFLKSKKLECEYIGFDCLQAMIDAGCEKYKGQKNCQFVCGKEFNIECDYLVGSGVFNYRGESEYHDWLKFVFAELSKIDIHTRKAFAVNFLTSYSEPGKMRDDLFYADPCVLFEHCMRNFSRNVAIMHDYGAWEFTLIVRK